MTPIINIDDGEFERAKKLLAAGNISYTLPAEKNSSHLGDFIYVPAIGLDVSVERIGLRKDWFNSHRLVQSHGGKMLTMPEFVEVLKYTKSNYPKIYEDITAVRSPWRAEWIDADFKVKSGALYINSNHVLDSKGNLIPKNSEILLENTLMEDKTPGISLEDWMENPTKQGFPNKETKSGNSYYGFPRSDNNSVARFDAFAGRTGLDCDRCPSGRGALLGVRVAKQHR